MNLLLTLESLVKVTFGNAKFLASSIFVAAVLVVVLENLKLPLSRVRSAFACWHSKRGTSCNSSSRSSSHPSQSDSIHMYVHLTVKKVDTWKCRLEVCT